MRVVWHELLPVFVLRFCRTCLPEIAISTTLSFFVCFPEVRGEAKINLMAKDGDIIDFLLGSVFQLFGWILGGIFKLLLSLLGAIAGGIVSLFKKQ